MRSRATSIVGLIVGLVLVFSGYGFARSLAMFAGFLAGFVIGWGIVLAVVFKFAFRSSRRPSWAAWSGSS